jgi:hypothetical protein
MSSRTASAAEAVVASLEEFGAHCVPQLRGEFVFVLWDEPNQTLFAAGDRFGDQNAAGNDAFAVGWHPVMWTLRKLIRTE